MTPEQLSQTLVQSEGLAYNPIAVTFIASLSDLPEGVKKFGSSSGETAPKSFLCAMWGDCLKGAGPFYTTKDQQICGGGAIAAGLGSLMPIEAAKKFMIGDGKLFRNMDALRCALSSTMPFEDGEFEAQIVGPLAAMNEDTLRPDEMLLAFPFGKLGTAVANLPRICRTSSMHKHTFYRER